MKIAIIGGGITGLTAAYELSKEGHSVSVFERESYLGGLAYGFKERNWNWHLEGAYHHMFTNDDAILSLSRELGIGDTLITKRPITSNLLPPMSTSHADPMDTVRTAQLDGPIQLFQFPGLSVSDKLRTGALAAFCKIYPFWKTLEQVTAKDFFIRWGGQNAWHIIWEPLMTGKFGDLDNTIAASWLWARIHKRTPSLVYFDGGFQTFVNAIEGEIIKNGGTIHTQASVESVQKASNNSFTLSWKQQNKKAPHTGQFDRILFTTPTPIANRILPGVASPDSLLIPHLHAQVLILETKQPILDTIYWLSITDRTFPFLAVVAHTNFMDKKHYGNHHITYIGNYLPNGHRYLTMTKQQLLKEFMPYISKLSRFTIHDLRFTKSYLFTAPYAQPVHQKNYSTLAPKLKTSIQGVFLANMDSIVPWDRGTNYAVALGKDAAAAILASDNAQ